MRLHSRPQLVDAEWLQNIIIPAQHQPPDSVCLFNLRSQEQDRTGNMGADPLAYFKTVKHGHADIQQYKIRLFIQLPQYLQPVFRGDYLIILHLEIILQKPDDSRFIIRY